MSFSGGYNGNGVNNNHHHHHHDWNDRYREQSTGRSSTNAFGTDPFGANDDFAGANHEFDNFNTTPATTTTAAAAASSSSSAIPSSSGHVPRFGRPVSRDLEADFDTSRSTTSPPRVLNSSAGGGGGGGGYRSSLSSQQYSDYMGNSPPGGGGGFDAIEPPRVSRASSTIQSRPSGSLARSNSTPYGSNDSGGATADALGVGVGVARIHDPYPSLRHTTSVGSHPRRQLQHGGSIGSNSHHFDNNGDDDDHHHSDLHQPGATSVAAARRSPNNNGDSSNKVQLPPKKEASPIMPPSLAMEPAMPRPKTSRRYMYYTKLERHPDLAVAKKVKNARYKAGDDDHHVLKCPNCQSFLKIPKMAVLMQCPTCSTVSPATSTVS